MSFSDLGLTPDTLRAIADVGYDKPTPIQEQAIPYVLMCRDVLGIAQTGTGKTASFTLPMIDILAQGRAKARMPRSLIIAPTRELAAQVAENFKLYGKYHKLAMALLIGGESFREQEAALDKGVDVLIATPGRLLDLFERGRILLTDVKILVIDEADRMLDMGFIPDVERIVSLLPKIRQTLFFSATMDKQIRKLADAFLMNPKEVRVDPQTSTAATVKQALAVVDHHDKRRALREWLKREDVRNAFIFCNRKRDVGVLYRSLAKHGFDVVQLHGDMPQSERTVTLDRFRKGEAALMVCSDVAARGIDISDVSHVFNFDVPSHAEDYIHRIGRTGRAGKEGHAYTLAAPEDAKYVDAIEKLIGKPIPRVDLESVGTTELTEDDRRGRKRGGTPGRSRGRGGSEGGERGRQPEAAPAPAAAAVPAEAAPAAPQEVRAPERMEEPARDGRDGRDGRGASRGRGGKGRNGRGRDGHPAWEVEEMNHGNDVTAFGGHTPAFMLVDPEVESARLRDEREAREAEAEKRRAAAETRKAERDAARAQDADEKAKAKAEADAAAAQAADEGEAAPAEAAQPEAAAEAEPKKRRRTRRTRKEPAAQPPAEAVEAAVAAVDDVVKGDEPKAPETTVEPAGEPVGMEPAPGEGSAADGTTAAEPRAESAAEAEAAEAEQAPAEEKPKRTRTTRGKTATAKTTTARKPAAKKATTTRSRKKAAEPEAEATPEAPAEAPAENAAPVEAPAEAPAAEAEAEAAPAEEKPKRTRRAPAKKATTAKTAAAKKTTAAKSTTTTRKRTTRKKAEPAAEAEAAPAPEGAETPSAQE